MSQTSGGNGEGLYGRPENVYRKDCSLLFDVGDNKKISAKDIISAACKLVGHEKVFGCVPRSGNMYELTLADRETVDRLEDGMTVGKEFFEAKRTIRNTFVMSIMHLPTYVSDGDIKDKFKNFEIDFLSPIKRRYIEVEGNKFADGTRFCKVRLPEYRRSLPFTMKFSDGDSDNYYRIIHDGQCKVCSMCGSDKHLRKECPDFECFKCGLQGHMKRFCTTERCLGCHRFACVCEDDYEMDDINEMSENEDGNEDTQDNTSETETGEPSLCEQCGNMSNDCSCKPETQPTNKEEENVCQNNDPERSDLAKISESTGLKENEDDPRTTDKTDNLNIVDVCHLETNTGDKHDDKREPDMIEKLDNENNKHGNDDDDEEDIYDDGNDDAGNVLDETTSNNEMGNNDTMAETVFGDFLALASETSYEEKPVQTPTAISQPVENMDESGDSRKRVIDPEPTENDTGKKRIVVKQTKKNKKRNK